MDYTKYYPKDLKALLSVLKQQSPEMYKDLTSPMGLGPYSPLDMPFETPFYTTPLNDLRNTVGRGYDPNLIMQQEVASNDNSQLDTIAKLAVANPMNSMDTLEGNPDYFYSDSVLDGTVPRTAVFDPENGGWDNPIDLSTVPAYASAQQFISGGVPRIGNSDYTIDDLRRNGMSEPDILALIRRLANQGYEI